MQVSYAKPIEKGVTTLMYVGDDGLPHQRSPLAYAFVAVGVIGLLKAKKTSTKVMFGAGGVIALLALLGYSA